MESIGQRLKKIRLEKGIPLDEVQKKTKIHPDILKAIEDDSFVDLNPVYIKGFLKIYCKFLGLNPDDYIPTFKEANVPIRISPKNSDTTPSFLRPPSQDRPRLITPQRVFLAASIAGVIVLLFVLISLGRVVIRKITSAPKKANRPAVSAPVSTARPVAQKPRRTEIPKPAQPVSKEMFVPSASSSVIKVGLHALEDCWIQAKVDGKMVFQNVLRKGRFEAWEAKEKVELSVGSAGGVQLELNGKVMPSLGRRGMVLKNILITRDGLKVNK